MRNFIKKYWIYLLFIVLGITGGYLYWFFIGCNSGTCPITSVWHNSAVFGGVFGYFTGEIVIDVVNKKKEKL